MLNLIKNEYVKILKKKSTIIWLAVLLVLSFGLLFLTTSVSSSLTDSESFSASYVTEQLESGIDSTSDEYVVFSKLKELGLYDKDNSYYMALYEALSTFPIYSYPDDTATNAVTNEANKKLFDEAAQLVANSDSKGFLSLLSSHYKNPNYTFEDKKELSDNPYKYCLEHDIDIFKDTKLMEYVVIINNLSKSLSSQYTPNGQQTSAYNKYYNSYVIYTTLLEEKQTNAIIDANNNPYGTDSMPMSDGSITVSTEGSGTSIDSKFWNVLKNSASFMTMIELLIIIIAGSCVASEFSDGTIKFLLINPVKRGKIITSKYAMIFSFSFFCMVGYYIISTIFAVLLGGVGDFGGVYISATNGSIISYSGFLYVAKLYLYGFVDIICYGTMAFMLSSLFKSASISIGISIALALAGSMATGIIRGLNLDWGRYLFFANTDLLSINNGQGYFPNQTVSFSVVVLLIHLAVFLLTAYDGFTRREV